MNTGKNHLNVIRTKVGETEIGVNVSDLLKVSTPDFDIRSILEQVDLWF